MATRAQDLPAQTGTSKWGRRYAGIPLYAWAAGGVALVGGIVYFLLRKKSSTTTTTTTSGATTSTTGTAPSWLTTGGGGGGSGSGGGGTTVGRSTPPATPGTPASAGTVPTTTLPTVQPVPFTSGKGVSLETPTGALTTGTVRTGTSSEATTIKSYTQTLADIEKGLNVGYITARTNKIVPLTSVSQFEQLEGGTSSGPGKGKQTTTYTYT